MFFCKAPITIATNAPKSTLAWSWVITSLQVDEAFVLRQAQPTQPVNLALFTPRHAWVSAGLGVSCRVASSLDRRGARSTALIDRHVLALGRPM